MKIHHLDCGTMCPYGASFMMGGPDHMVCHCLLIEAAQGLILVDTGLGLKDRSEPVRRLGFAFAKMVRPDLDPERSAARQIERLGFALKDVRHIVLTHLDPDHGGGLADFPDASVHVFEDEWQAAHHPTLSIEKTRYRPMQWDHGVKWVKHRVSGDRWNGFDAVRRLHPELKEDIALIPLKGHTQGHCGVLIPQAEAWMLHAGDSYFHRGEMDVANPHCTLGLRLFQKRMQTDAAARLGNQARLREAKAGLGPDRLKVFCSHDPVELAAFQPG
jgi:glyoxylase-like metal-dependent hydrolase (beta-lactamase superfamily II)